MKKVIVCSAVCLVAVTMASMVSAQQPSWGVALKSATQAAGQTFVQQMSPQAQTTLAQSNKLATGAPQENFLLAKAKEYLAGGNYQTALDLANYVVTMLDSRSVDAKKIMVDAKASLTKLAQEKLTQAQPQLAASGQQGQAQVNAAGQVATSAGQTVSGLKSLFGAKK